jgi:glycosyltransferase involved in cell wall biosynthesis
VDAHCPSGRLPSITCNLLQQFDKVAGWTKYGQDVLGLSQATRQSYAKTSYLPLGLDSLWTRGDVERGRQILGVLGKPILGAVGTNQPRKDWGLVFQAFSLMPEEWCLWAHVDKRHDYWNLNQLVEEYGLGNRVRFTVKLSDEQLADCYAACAVTFGLGRGEGFGYPIVESQLAGTPCLTFCYGGGAELACATESEGMLLRPEGPYSFLRPVLRPGTVANRLRSVVDAREGQEEYIKSLATPYLWENGWPAWEAWFREGGVLGP